MRSLAVCRCAGSRGPGRCPTGSTARRSRSCGKRRSPRKSPPSARPRPITRRSRPCAGRGSSSRPAGRSPPTSPSPPPRPPTMDDHLLALRADASLDLHVVHGVTVTASRDGQAAAAFADILLRGLSQTRMRRLNTLLRAYAGPFGELPKGWTRILPADAPLSSADAWARLLDRLTAADWPDGSDHGPALRRHRRPAVPGNRSRRGGGRDTAARAGARDLAQGAQRRRGRIARPHPGDAEAGRRSRSLRLGLLDAGERSRRVPPSAMRPTAGAQLRRDGRAACHGRPAPPRPHHSGTAELDPLPVTGLADRRDFATIRATTAESELVLSRTHGATDDGRPLGPSVAASPGADLQRGIPVAATACSGACLQRNRPR